MNIIFLSNLIISFLCVLKFLFVNGANSCENSIPNPMLDPLLSSPGQHFGALFYEQLKGGPMGLNVFFCPFSILMGLAMVTDDKKFNNTASTLQVEGSPAKSAFQQYLLSLCPDDKFTLSIATRIYLQNNFPLERALTETFKTIFSSGEAENVDFWSNPLSVSMYINQWVEQKTLNTIKHLISIDVADDTVLVPINTVYFNGKWEIPFDSALTKTNIFDKANGHSTAVPTMFSRNYFKYTYHYHLKSQILQLNYAGGRFALFIILPERGIKLTDIHKESYLDVMDSMRNASVQLVEVSLPKFKASFMELQDCNAYNLGILNLMGNLSRMTTNPETKVSGVAHKAFVDLDEDGTTASSATAFMLGLRTLRPPPQHIRPALPLPRSFPPPPSSSPVRFKVDRHCFYLICDIKFRHILFMGGLENPSFYIEPSSTFNERSCDERQQDSI